MYIYVYTHVCTSTYILSGTIPKGGPVTLRVLGKHKGGGYVLQKALQRESTAPARLSFTGQLAVEAGEPDGEGLERAQRVAVVQGEHVVGHTSKLHDYVVR